MSLQILARPRGYRERFKLLRSRLAALAYRVKEHCIAFFTHLLAALDESRRREVARIFRQYRYLIDE